MTWADAISLKISFFAFMANWIIYCVFGVFFAVLSAVLVKKFAPFAAGSGISEVKTILGGFIVKGFLGLNTLFIKCIGLVFSVASGLCVGKEGPMVHIACCCANVFTRFFNKYSLIPG